MEEKVNMNFPRWMPVTKILNEKKNEGTKYF